MNTELNSVQSTDVQGKSQSYFYGGLLQWIG